MKIVSRWDSLKVLHQAEAESMRLLVEAAVKACANLQGANLQGANLQGANLQGADLWGANLQGANLQGADLWGAKSEITDLTAFLASGLGAVFSGKNKRATLYRVTNADGSGKYNGEFKQEPGRVDVDHKPAGEGTCVAGIHATSAQIAWSYFDMNIKNQLWAIEFTREDLLDCDGKKVRLRGGWCRKVDWPWGWKKQEQDNG